MDKKEKEKKLEKLVHKCYKKTNGNRIRHIVRVVAKAYKENPEELIEYFDSDKHDELVVGIATSAYHFLTEDIRPIQTKEHGGLGAIITIGDDSLSLLYMLEGTLDRYEQLQYANLKLIVTEGRVKELIGKLVTRRAVEKLAQEVKRMGSSGQKRSVRRRVGDEIINFRKGCELLRRIGYYG